MTTMGIDQFGVTYHNLGKYPRKRLLDRLGFRCCQKMYKDGNNGEVIHVGYIVGTLWIELFNVTPWEKKP